MAFLLETYFSLLMPPACELIARLFAEYIFLKLSDRGMILPLFVLLCGFGNCLVFGLKLGKAAAVYKIFLF